MPHLQATGKVQVPVITAAWNSAEVCGKEQYLLVMCAAGFTRAFTETAHWMPPVMPIRVSGLEADLMVQAEEVVNGQLTTVTGG